MILVFLWQVNSFVFFPLRPAFVDGTIRIMEKRLHYLIKENEQGITIEHYLKERGFSHRILSHLRRTPLGILKNGEEARTISRLMSGDRLDICLREETSSETIVPADLPLTIVYEDEDLMVINKAAKVPVHPSQGNYDNTLANSLAYYFQTKGEAFVFRAVNRLDRDTTGLLLIAKHMLSGALLSAMVAEKSIRREYLAIACGETEEAGTIRLPIARKDGSTIERCVDFEHGESACTHYHRLSYNPKYDCSLVLLILETGRTHQIRVHMKAIGHPLPGDFLYHPDCRLIDRQALHSYRLSFVHPITGKAMAFEAPVPNDFNFMIERPD